MNEEIIKAIFGNEIVNRLHNNLCPMYGQEINESDFRDELSKREYNISGMCQQCQDKIIVDFIFGLLLSIAISITFVVGLVAIIEVLI